MSESDWRAVIDQAVALDAQMVQFIGGEPTLHRALPELIEYARRSGLAVEVFSNLVHVLAEVWEALSRPGVHLATSYYSDDPAEHAVVTRRNTYARTRANIAEALRRSVPLRVGVVNLADDQRSDQAVSELRELGVSDIGTDHLRAVGRGGPEQSLDQLCGQCGHDKIAISPTGEVWPCVFSRWMPVGNVREHTLADIIAGAQMANAETLLREHFTARQAPCVPRMCNPQCGPSCSPSCRPRGNCRPSGGCVPKYR